MESPGGGGAETGTPPGPHSGHGSVERDRENGPREWDGPPLFPARPRAPRSRTVGPSDFRPTSHLFTSVTWLCTPPTSHLPSLHRGSSETWEIFDSVVDEVPTGTPPWPDVRSRPTGRDCNWGCASRVRREAEGRTLSLRHKGTRQTLRPVPHQTCPL